MDDGIEDVVNNLASPHDSLLTDVNFAYDGGDSPHFSIDRVTNTESEILYQSEDGYGRLFLNESPEGYKTIASTIVMGALRDGDSLSMKTYLMAEIVDYMLGITTITDIQEAFGNHVQQQAVAYPNPASTFTNLSFHLDELSDVSLAVFDEMGRMVSLKNYRNLASGDQNLQIDLNDFNGNSVKNGIYFYQISTDKNELSGKFFIQR